MSRTRDVGTVGEPLDWQDRAACLDYDTERFFITGPVPASTRAICKGCPVRRPCLDFAMAMEGDSQTGMGRHGIFGGFTAQERGRLAGRMRRAQLPDQRTPPLEETA